MNLFSLARMRQIRPAGFLIEFNLIDCLFQSYYFAPSHEKEQNYGTPTWRQIYVLIRSMPRNPRFDKFIGTCKSIIVSFCDLLCKSHNETVIVCSC